MGWKKASIQVQAEAKKQHQAQERLRKKYELLGEKRKKPLEALNKLYASGKIDDKEYKKLKERDEEVTVDLFVFGKSAGSKLAEQYITGKIDSVKFESMKNEILGAPEAERDAIQEKLDARQEKLNIATREARKNISDSACAHCSKPKKKLRPLVKEVDFKVCIPCKAKFSNMKKKETGVGKFYTFTVGKLSADGTTVASMKIHDQHVLKIK